MNIYKRAIQYLERAERAEAGREIACRIAWQQGWHEHHLQNEMQRRDPSHAITQERNPYKAEAES